MAIPFAINTGSTISGTTQVGDIAVGDTSQDYSSGPGGVQWWMGPDDGTRYIVARLDPNFGHTSPAGGNPGLSFRGSEDLTESSYVELANSVSLEAGGTGITSSSGATIWFGEQGNYTTFESEAESTDLFTRMDVQPSTELKNLINLTIRDLKYWGLWDGLYCFTKFNLHTEQASLLNWVVDQALIAYNSPTWTGGNGFSFTATNYLDTLFSRHLLGDTWKSEGYYGAEFEDDGVSYHMGAFDDDYQCFNSNGRYFGSSTYFTGTTIENNNIILKRKGLDGFKEFIDGLETVDNDRTMTGDGDGTTFIINGFNNRGTQNQGNTQKSKGAVIGHGMTDGNVLIFNNIIGNFNTNVGTAIYGSDEYQALYDSWTNKPSEVVSAAYNIFFKKLKGDNATGVDFLNDRFDAAWLFGGHTNDDGEMLKNIVNPGANDATLVNAPYFNNFSGFKGDAATKRVALNWNATDDGVKYILNDASFGVYGLDDVEVGHKYHGIYDVTGQCNIYSKYVGNIRVSINTQYSRILSTSTTNVGLKIGTRNDGTSLSAYNENGFNTSSAAQDASFALNHSDLSVLVSSDERIGFAYVGESVTEGECIDLESILDWWFNFEWLALGDELNSDPDFNLGKWDTGSQWIYLDPYMYYSGTTNATTVNGDGLFIYQNKSYLVEFETDGESFFGCWDGTSYDNFPFQVRTSGLQRFIYTPQPSTDPFNMSIRGAASGTRPFTLKRFSIKEIIGLTI